MSSFKKNRQTPKKTIRFRDAAAADVSKVESEQTRQSELFADINNRYNEQEEEELDFIMENEEDNDTNGDHSDDSEDEHTTTVRRAQIRINTIAAKDSMYTKRSGASSSYENKDNDFGSKSKSSQGNIPAFPKISKNSIASNSQSDMYSQNNASSFSSSKQSLSEQFKLHPRFGFSDDPYN